MCVCVCFVRHSKSTLPRPRPTCSGLEAKRVAGRWRGWWGREGLGVAPWPVLSGGALVAGGGAAADIFIQLGERLIYSIRSVIEGTIGVFF